MRRVYRLISWLIIATGAAFVALGLWNAQRGLPAGSLVALRELPGELHAQARRALDVLASRDDSPAKPGDSLQALRIAIGCEAPSVQAADPGTDSASYRWRDGSGVMNFSDSAPEHAASTLQSMQTGHDEFFVTVRAEEAVLPATVEGQINAGAKRVYDQWRDWLGDGALVRSHINIRFIGDSARFYAIFGKAPGEDWTATGFYRIQNNEALVLYAPGYRADALDTAFHEVSHLIAAWQLGLTPPWLNEGLAEHFETMQVSWQSARFADNATHRALLRERGPLPLDELLALSPREWNAVEPAHSYASAWSLIAFLLDSQTGRETLREVVQEAHAQRCSAQGDLAESLDSYPGGRRTLESDWQRWIQRG